MSKILCFTFSDYRKYLEARMPIRGADRGLRARLAETLRCQNAFISRVIAGDAHFSLDHAIQVSDFLGHSELESEYFLLLVQESRASTQALTSFLRKKRAEILKKKDMFVEHLKVGEELSSEEKMTYYSSWHYAAMHVMITVPELQTVQALARHLHLPLIRVQQVLDFLESAGLAQLNGDKYSTGKSRIHLGKGSPMLPKHHTNWRMRAIQALDQAQGRDFFYSGPVSFSQENIEVIRRKLFKLLEETEPVFQNSKEECAYCLNIDFFHL
jgi:uncharacterized protein (TIGR02147 family)